MGGQKESQPKPGSGCISFLDLSLESRPSNYKGNTWKKHGHCARWMCLLICREALSICAAAALFSRGAEGWLDPCPHHSQSKTRAPLQHQPGSLTQVHQCPQSLKVPAETLKFTHRAQALTCWGVSGRRSQRT